jgi:hypothetical protein
MSQNQKCAWCGGDIYEDEGVGSSMGLIHFDCAHEVQMDDRASEQESYYEDSPWD